MGLTVSGSVTPEPLITASTSLPEARPWWQVMQRASPPRLSTLAPEGKVTDESASAAGLWQVLQPVTGPGGAGRSTFPATQPPPPRESAKPGGGWERAPTARA